jgi:hypothetical protein
MRELLQTPDDRSVILAPGDEIAPEFDATALPPVAPGWAGRSIIQSPEGETDPGNSIGHKYSLLEVFPRYPT